MAYPIGGEENAQYVILEMHYDNPAEVSGLCTHTLEVTVHIVFINAKYSHMLIGCLYNTEVTELTL